MLYGLDGSTLAEFSSNSGRRGFFRVRVENYPGRVKSDCIEFNYVSFFFFFNFPILETDGLYWVETDSRIPISDWTRFFHSDKFIHQAYSRY